ncbi:GlcNAc-PI de-N-acetylase [Pseudomonas sp. URMO17WK12:I11]|nr:LmbE family N-acetylglucosaminyl deacetylase [Pseudomonas sp. URIL14HWK12:I1]CRN05737.1 GlcNAc-PI de-N-acetylase [Pseudomonas sp. URMO17WK12:I11]SNB66889.1 N-acetylglucosaminyl deacetylase, LmbE family [Pseudomonas sp. LAIL14HWK12:I4]
MPPRAGVPGVSRKQQLLKRHRRNKRLALLVALAALIALGLVTWWLPLLLLPLLWVAHEAWLADHLFYTPADDYTYAFDEADEVAGVSLKDGRLQLPALPVAEGATWVLQVELRCALLGRFLDPGVSIEGAGGEDLQVFERGVRGKRYLNLTGLDTALRQGQITLRGRFCRLVGQPRLWMFQQPDLRRKRVMVIAPHADDAELAAYGLYSQADEAWIVTLTAGEIEAEHYQAMGLSSVEAARLKGRLRAWDSIAVPRWAGVAQARCVQLGYFCLQLPAMRQAPTTPFGSREADMADTRPFRTLNALSLPGDDGVPTWHNLLADVRALIQQARPEVIVMPHPVLDPHPDHVAAQQALQEALQGLPWQPEILLGYANHLHDNDRWPMGDSGAGVALPPVTHALSVGQPCTLVLDRPLQLDKAMALGMMHDLQPRPPFKRRVRRVIQRWLAGRRSSPYGENEFFRKAVRRHELFWVLTDRHQGVHRENV